ncbi:chromosome segregation protein SMC [Arthrobacter agilis]|uniref:chromosome segregation protein SMC n=1 Tax=Arthrobacter agilis TaxID=37921 RepID=UPI000B355240|nr:chromosome segregation protein SMC [Arthrobacter agilis]OUM44826.1 chromosome segregation protein SMC [Arthrobacter agilis]PPB47150.1 chromosome segregation protein SMC [Arthrobacter agilis]TPV22564.1 chromosome segregation protein SMC [Arthrobacter agilis]VDR32389.1 Chromosome partition protein Smc [Arthrobacter agilis]
MHLKSLTVRGFKSFASATTFEFEPGVTAVVGPNGSGKSNVVDALAWVMGEQGAKTLRGGKMEDVIFAGTSGRPPLGRAHVSLTIDNADGALPIEYSEVTISRTLFRAGGSEYAINGKNCRLLDIQELLSDSGLGREMHVIVGQGQLDKVLHATPEDRRGFIEEAAGILKHRRRREKTVRKLDAMQANLARLSDLTGELRRQLTPLGKQADVARRAQQVQFAVRDARSRLLADELVTLRAGFERDVAAESALQARRDEVERALTAGRERQAALEQAAAAAVPALNRARETWYALSSVREKLTALAARADDRGHLLGQGGVEPDRGRDPDQLERQAARVRSEVSELEQEILTLGTALESTLAHRREAEDAAAAEDARLARLLRIAADRREGDARLAGTVGAARSRVESAVAELGRLRVSITEAEDRRRAAQREFTVLEGQVAGDEEGEEGLDADYEEAAGILAGFTGDLEALVRQEQAAERERGALAARLDAQQEGLQRRDGSSALLAAGLDGVSRPLAEILQVATGFEKAVAAVLAGAADAVAVESLSAAVLALEAMKQADAGQVSLVVAPGTAAGSREPEAQGRMTTGTVRAEGTPLLDVVAGASAVQPVLAHLLHGAVAVADLERARSVIEDGRAEIAVTLDGDVLSRVVARGGTPSAAGYLELRAAAEETEERLAVAVAETERLRFVLSSTRAARDSAQQRVDEALERLNESDARMAAVAERLGRLNAELRSASGDAERLTKLAEAAEAHLAGEELRLQDAARRLEDLQQQPVEADPSTERRDALHRDAVAARQAELEARLALRSREEQLTALANRAASLDRAAESERRARQQAAEKARLRQVQASKAAAVAEAARRAGAQAARSVALAASRRDEAERLREQQDAELQAVRARNAELGVEVARLTDSAHQDELARTQQRLTIEALENRSVEELGLTPDHLVEEFGPHQPVPEDAVSEDRWAALRTPVDDDGNPVPQGVPFVREQQEKRFRRAERDLAALGKVNPLALEEFAALEERHQFLSTQLADLKATRKDLLDIIREVDERVEQVFTAAYRDTAEQFERVFATLFPGGEGRLVLTDPEDMLATGIEVEARPAGKRIKRLSLLSGGERSLTAVALLVAIFKARPSPFYVMDEVEAALDDTNLGRLITIFRELRESSQLIIITHQKRTMEVADALYGVTMRGDGVSTVISQRLAEDVESVSGP